MIRSIGLFSADLDGVRPLRERLTEHGVPVTILIAGELRLDLAVRTTDLGLCVNLVGEDPPAPVRALTAEYLAYLADIEVPAVNGLDAFVVGSSRARQLALLDHLGVAHPPARICADLGGADAALADLGVGRDAAVIWEGPPVVVQAAPDVGPVVRIDYVAGRQVAATAQGEPVTVDLALGRLGAAIVQTGGIEFGGVSFGVDPATSRPTCVGVDIRLPSGAPPLDALAAHVLQRAGLP